jgi:hypothetical protein
MSTFNNIYHTGNCQLGAFEVGGANFVWRSRDGKKVQQVNTFEWVCLTRLTRQFPALTLLHTADPCCRRKDCILGTIWT